MASTSVSHGDIPKDATKDTILQTSRLFVRNLTFSCTEEDLTELFKPFGDISQVSNLFLYFLELLAKLEKM